MQEGFQTRHAKEPEETLRGIELPVRFRGLGFNYGLGLGWLRVYIGCMKELWQSAFTAGSGFLLYVYDADYAIVSPRCHSIPGPCNT